MRPFIFERSRPTSLSIGWWLGAVLTVGGCATNFAGSGAENIYVQPAGFDAQSGAILVGASFPDRGKICISTIDGHDVVYNKLQYAENGGKKGENEPSLCQKFADFKYVVAPGVHRVVAQYWPNGAVYSRAAEFSITTQAGQSYNPQRNDFAWSKSEFWFQDSAGNIATEKALVQFSGSYIASFGVFQPKTGDLIDDRPPVASYSGDPIRKLLVSADLGPVMDDQVSSFAGKFAGLLNDCGITSQARVRQLQGTEPLTLNKPNSAQAEKVSLASDVAAYQPDAVLEITFLMRRSPSQSGGQYAALASWMAVAAKLSDHTGRSLWKRDVEFNIPTGLFKDVRGSDYLAAALIGRLTEDGYFKGCRTSRMDWEN